MLQNKQMRQIKNNSMQISELKTQMVEFRRRLEETTSNQNISKMTSIDNSAGGSNNNSSTSTATTPISSPSSSSGCVVDALPTTTPEKALKNIKPRTATIILKRRIAEYATAAKRVKRDPVIDDK